MSERDWTKRLPDEWWGLFARCVGVLCALAAVGDAEAHSVRSCAWYGFLAALNFGIAESHYRDAGRLRARHAADRIEEAKS